MIRRNCCLIKHYLRRLDVSIETLQEEIKLAVAEKILFEFRPKSLKNTIPILGLSGLWCKEPADWNSKQILVFMCKMFVRELKEIKPVITEEHHFDNRDEPFLTTIFWKVWTIIIVTQKSKSKVFQPNSPLL